MSTLSYGEVKALAAGNPLLLEQANARTEVKKLRLLRSVHLQAVNAAKQSAERETRSAESMRRAGAGLLDVQELVDERGVPAVDVAALQRQVQVWQVQGRSYDRFRFGGFAVHAEMERHGDHPRITAFTVDLDYRTIATFDVDRKFARKSPRTIARWLAERIDLLLSTAGDAAERHFESADRADARAACARALAEGAVFDLENVPNAAIQRLAQIDASIDDQVREDQAPAGQLVDA